TTDQHRTCNEASAIHSSGDFIRFQQQFVPWHVRRCKRTCSGARSSRDQDRTAGREQDASTRYAYSGTRTCGRVFSAIACSFVNIHVRRGQCSSRIRWRQQKTFHWNRCRCSCRSGTLLRLDAIPAKNGSAVHLCSTVSRRAGYSAEDSAWYLATGDDYSL